MVAESQPKIDGVVGLYALRAEASTSIAYKFLRLYAEGLRQLAKGAWPSGRVQILKLSNCCGADAGLLGEVSLA
jgi:hypothetical protein